MLSHLSADAFLYRDHGIYIAQPSQKRPRLVQSKCGYLLGRHACVSHGQTDKACCHNSQLRCLDLRLLVAPSWLCPGTASNEVRLSGRMMNFVFVLFLSLSLPHSSQIDPALSLSSQHHFLQTSLRRRPNTTDRAADLSNQDDTLTFRMKLYDSSHRVSKQSQTLEVLRSLATPCEDERA
jgi:hypothetical protein